MSYYITAIRQNYFDKDFRSVPEGECQGKLFKKISEPELSDFKEGVSRKRIG